MQPADTPVPDTPAAADRNGLLAGLLYIARHHGRAVSANAIMAGLPITDGVLRPTLFLRAAARADLVAEPFARPLDEIPNLVLPALLLLRDGRALVLLRNDPGAPTVEVVEPDLTTEQSRVWDRAQLLADYSGYTFFLKPSGGAAERGGIRRTVETHWFWSTLALFRSNYIHIAIAAFLINLMALAFPLFTMNVYDRVLPNGAIPSLIALAIGVLIAFAFDFVLRLVRSRMIDLTGKQIDVTLAARLFSHILGLKMVHRPRSAGVLANQIRDFESVREFFTSGTVISVTDLLFALVFLIVMFTIVGPLALIPLILLPVSLAIGYLIQKPLDRAVREVQAESATRHGILVESIGAIETIRALGAESRIQTHWERSVASSARATEAVHHWSSLSLTLSSTAQNLASLLIIVWGVFLVLNNQISVGALIAANMLSGRILAPVANLASVLMRGARTMQSLRAIDQLMRLEVERPEAKVFVARTIKEGRIRFEDVGFRYPGAEADALTKVSFTINPGERVGIIGRIGSGKTTVGRLIDGFYAPATGRILIDGVDIRQYDPADLRAGVGFVMQDCELFHATLRENITIGFPSASEAALLEAASLSGVEAFAAQSPLGYDMPVTEGGRSLSGGQRQCIALARVLIRQPRILFLDEPTSALDLRSEAEFAARLSQVRADATVIISTHRVSLLKVVDRLIVFDHGRVVADGPREAVLAALQAKVPAKAGQAPREAGGTHGAL